MPRTKEGEKISWKEFMSRWKKGIEGITPLQKLKAQRNGINLQLIGLLLGFVISILNYKQLWWLTLILFGGLIVTGVQKLGIKQQIINLEDFESTTEEINLEDLMNE